MPRNKVKSIAPIAVDTDGIAVAQAVAGAANLTLNGALISGGAWLASDGLGRKITILSAGNDAGITFTVTGSDPEGRSLSETITGGNTTTVTGSEYFAGITNIASSGAAAGNVSVGISKYFRSKAIPLNHYASDGPPVCAVSSISGVIDVTIQECFGDIQNNRSVAFYPVSNLSNVEVDTRSTFTSHSTAVRLIGNNYNTGATCLLEINQNGV